MPLCRKFTDDLPNVVNEAHIEHPIGFIEHQKLDIVKLQRIAVHQVEQASRRRHQHVDAAEECAHLALHGYAPDHQRAGDLEMTPVGLKAVEDLAGQLARRAQHQGAAALARSGARIGCEVVQNRQGKGCCLAGAGLCNADHIAP